MTDKHNSSSFSIESLRSVTDKRNNKVIHIPPLILAYRSYLNMPNTIKGDVEPENLERIIEDFAILYKIDKVYHLRAVYERYLATLIDGAFEDLYFTTSEDDYRKHFKIYQYTKLAHKLYDKDILFVYPDNSILVVVNGKTAENFREVRGNK